MAITIIDRPRQLVYYTSASPAEPVYSTWNAGWNPIVYSFNVLASDILSSLILNIYEIGTNTLLASNTIRPFRAGTWNVDISPYVRAYLFSEFKTDFTTSENCKDAGNNLNFYVTYTQIFDANISSIFNSDQSNPIIVSCSAMQFGDVNGGNMIGYTPFNFDLPDDNKMKFLSAFDIPVMWDGWPLTISFIYSTNIIGVQNVKFESYRDCNENQILATHTNLDVTKIGSVNYLKINNPSQLHTKSILVSLSTGDTIENYYVDEGYVDDGYTQIN